MATMAEYAGEYCKNLGLTIDEHPPTMKIANIKKGPIYELSQIRKSRGTSWIKFYESVKSICDSSFKVLEQSGPRELFFMSKNKKKLTVDEVMGNLLSLISLSHTSMSTPSSPFIATQESLIGRRICHKWREPDGSEHLYYGKILSLVPGTTDWFNVIYDGEDTVLSLNLFIDIERGDINFVD